MWRGFWVYTVESLGLSLWLVSLSCFKSLGSLLWALYRAGLLSVWWYVVAVV